VSAGAQVRGSGKVISVTSKLEPFSVIEINAGDQLEITQGSARTLTIEAEDNLQPFLKTTVSDGKLRLNWKPLVGTASSSSSITVNGKRIIVPGGVQNLSIVNGQVTINGVNIEDTSLTIIEPQKPIVYRLTVPDLDRVTASQNVRVTCQKLQTNSLGLNVSGGGRMSFSGLTAANVEARVSGSGRIALTGGAGRQDIRVSGSGLVDTSRLAGTVARIRVSGSGDVRTAATATLDVSISGSGKVTYTGSPKITRKITGSGKLIRSEKKK